MEQDVEMKKEKKKINIKEKTIWIRKRKCWTRAYETHITEKKGHPQDRYITMYLSKLYLRHYLHGDPQAYRESLQTSTET